MPEPFHRYMKHHNFKFQKDYRLFFTKLSNETINGCFPILTDLFLTEQSLNTQIFGPQNITKLFESIRLKFNQKILPYSICDLTSDAGERLIGMNNNEEIKKIGRNKDFQNSMLKNEYQNFLKQQVNSKFINDAWTSVKNSQELGRFYEDQYIKIIGLEQQQKQKLSYLCVTPKMKGKMNQEKISKIPDKMRGVLVKKGEIELNGEIIKLSDVQDPDQAGIVLMILDLDTLDDLSAIMNNLTVQKFQDQNINNNEVKVACLLHIVSKEVILSQQFKQFIQLFKNAQHMFVSTSVYNNEFVQNLKTQDNLKHFQNSNLYHSQQPNYFCNLKSHYEQIIDKLQNLINIDQLFQDNGLKMGIVKNNFYFNLNQEGVSAVKINQQNQENKQNIQVDQEQQNLQEQSCQNQKQNPIQQQQNISAQQQIQFEEQQQNQQEQQNNEINNQKNQQVEEQKQSQQQQQQSVQKQNQDIKIHVLGTSCMMPTTYRNVSCYLIQHDNLNILLDAGDGSFAQIQNQFQDEIDNILIGLQIIFISHHHSDHYLGYQKIIYERNQAFKRKNKQLNELFLLIPYVQATWFLGLSDFMENITNVNAIFLQDFESDLIARNLIDAPSFQEFQQKNVEESKQEQENNYKQQQEQQQQQLKDQNSTESQSQNELKNKNIKQQQEEELQDSICEEDDNDANYKELRRTLIKQVIENRIYQNLSKIKSIEKFYNFLQENRIERMLICQAIHTQESYAISIQFQNSIKITYSGDSRPSIDVIKIAQNSHLLIHEASFNNDQQEYACKAHHSSLNDALNIGIQTQSRRTLLTHFSRRIQKFNLDDENKMNQRQLNYYKNNCIIAFDHMKFNISDCEPLTQISQNFMSQIKEEK